MQRRFRVDEYFYFQANFEREGGDGRYPPPTLHALLISYLIKTDDKNINLKHRLIQYIFLDMASCLSKKEEQTENELIFVENLIKFPSAFSVPPSIIKLTQAFWLLDNEVSHTKINLIDYVVKGQMQNPPLFLGSHTKI